MFGLVYLFNSVSIFVGYLIPKLFLKKKSRDTIYPIAGGNKGVHTFPKAICSKVNVIAQLVFELANFEAAVKHFSHYALGTFHPAIFVLVTYAVHRNRQEG